ncbi:hypothetical protein Droror1_Dr00012528 [Drosera rotundifolia]
MFLKLWPLVLVNLLWWTKILPWRRDRPNTTLVVYFWLNQHWHKVEYEGLDRIYFNYVFFRHKSDTCLAKEVSAEVPTKIQADNLQGLHNKEQDMRAATLASVMKAKVLDGVHPINHEDVAHEEWMVIQRDSRTKQECCSRLDIP